MIDLLTEKEVAVKLAVSLASLRRWRVLRRGPTFTKLGSKRGSAVRYKPEDVETWLASLPKGGEPVEEKGQAA